MFSTRTCWVSLHTLARSWSSRGRTLPPVRQWSESGRRPRKRKRGGGRPRLDTYQGRLQSQQSPELRALGRPAAEIRSAALETAVQGQRCPSIPDSGRALDPAARPAVAADAVFRECTHRGDDCVVSTVVRGDRTGRRARPRTSLACFGRGSRPQCACARRVPAQDQFDREHSPARTSARRPRDAFGLHLTEWLLPQVQRRRWRRRRPRQLQSSVTHVQYGTHAQLGVETSICPD